MFAVPKVLLVIDSANEKAQLQELLAPHAELTWVSDWHEAVQRLKLANYDAVFCACTLSDSSWRKVLEEAQWIDPNLPVIILSESANAAEYSEVLAAGAFDLLGIPYFEQQLVPAMTHALVSHEARVRYDNAQLPVAKVN